MGLQMKSILRRRLRIKSQRGLTLPELMISMVLCAFVMLGGGEIFRQLVTASATNTDTLAAVIQVQTSAFWLSQDALQAQYVNRGANETGGFPLTLRWVDWGNTTHIATYDIGNTTNDLGETLWELNRTYNQTGETILVAEHLVPFDDGEDPGIIDDDSGTRCYWGNNTLTFEVEAKVGVQTQERSYEFRPRPLN